MGLLLGDGFPYDRRTLDKLIRGLLHFRKNDLPALRPKFAQLADGQSPDTLFLACADSRVVPNLMLGMSGDPGELFTIRSVGNLIAPADLDGNGIGDVSEAGAVEYAIQILGVKDVVICGHSRCGAMAAVLEGTATPALSNAPNLVRWLDHGVPSLSRVREAENIDHTLPLVEQLSQVNVLQQLDHLRTYAFLREREDAGSLTLHAWWFDVATGDTYIFDVERGGYVLLDEEEGARIIKHTIPAPRLTFLPPA